MNLYTALRHRLANYSGLSALVGTRVYAVKLPQNVTYPAVTYQIVGGLPRTHLMGGDDALAAPRVQVSAWDTSLTDAISVADQIKAALQDYSGTMGGDAGITVQHIFLESEQIDIYDSEAEVHNVAQDFLIWREES